MAPHAAGIGGDQDQCRGPLGIGGSEQGAHRSSLGPTHDRGLIRSGVVHDCSDVVHEIVESLGSDQSVREPGTPSIKDHHPGEGGESFEKPGVGRPGPVLLQIRHVARSDHQVHRARTEHLVRNVLGASSGVAKLPGHLDSLAVRPPRRVRGADVPRRTPGPPPLRRTDRYGGTGVRGPTPTPTVPHWRR